MRLILADDTVLLREGMVRLMEEEGHEVIASVGDGQTLIAAVTRFADAGEPPDVVVVDVRMPPTHTDEGLRAALTIRERWPDIGVLVLSQYVEKAYATELITSGQEGFGYLLKDRVMRVEEFVEALDRIGAGGVAFDPDVVRQLLARTTHTDPLSKLTPREREVLALMAEGHTNQGIAGKLFISQSAVEKNVNALLDKLGIAPEPGYSRRSLAIATYLTN
ncbi:LuxR family two component transcriptional regulator [Kribbella amoyensis]|uniref:LuxR family two component transcriptional regulator n=1 Tax=Kribbella amoyensis TaxID=996641 RepID=A0A561B7G6_9ACTN|nr:response regulator transcription factor [Kribbella amoyensis]TWD74891.1 LuxR family two component transcriptional regulator [Kribbella amoyensis]